MSESSRVDPEVPLMEFPEQDVVEVDGPHPVGSFLQSDVVLFQGLREEELLRFEAERACIRDEAHQVMPGYSGCARRRGYGRGDGCQTVAGGCWPSASCGRWWLYSARKRWKRRCWPRRGRAGGRGGSALRARCMRPWAPFCPG